MATILICVVTLLIAVFGYTVLRFLRKTDE
jgi:purine-cytosine permease-like protein